MSTDSTEQPTPTTLTIGIDLGDKDSALCILGPTEQKQKRTLRTSPQKFREYFSTLPRCHVVMEVGVHSRWASALLQELGHEVTVANANKLALISRNHRKTDDTDAELLARLGRADKSLLSPVQHRSEAMQMDLAVVHARDLCVRARTQQINHIRGTLKAAGVRLSKGDAGAMHKRWLEVPEALRPALDPLFDVLQTLTEKIRAYDRQISDLCKRYAGTDVMSTIVGVGDLSALTYVLTLQRPERFKKSRHVGGYLGLQARCRQSGASDPSLGISKAGNPYLRRLLVQCANYILGPFGPDSDLRRWGLQLCARGGKNAKKRAKVAVARKLSVLMHRLWVSGEVYQPLGYHAALPIAA